MERPDPDIRKRPDLTIRNAREDDAAVIARCVMAALGKEDTESPSEFLVDICRERGTLYSWENTIVCDADGVAAAVMVSYDGNLYTQMREKTFNMVKSAGGPDLFANPLETGPGEYYLDSLAALPQYRGLGLGKILMENAIDRAQNAGYDNITLVADPLHPRLISYYESIGFRTFGAPEVFFGTEFIRMRLHGGESSRQQTQA